MGRCVPDPYRVNNAVMGPGDALYKYLRAAIAEALEIRFLVAFVTESGARLLPSRCVKLRTGAPVTFHRNLSFNTEPYPGDPGRKSRPALSSGSTLKPAVPFTQKPTFSPCLRTVRSSSVRPTSPGRR